MNISQELISKLETMIRIENNIWNKTFGIDTKVFIDDTPKKEKIVERGEIGEVTLNLVSGHIKINTNYTRDAIAEWRNNYSGVLRTMRGEE